MKIIEIADEVYRERVNWWLGALRSGDYLQGFKVLHATDTLSVRDRFCCLGVACDVAIKHGLTLEETRDLIHSRVRYGSHNVSLLPDIVADWYGLTTTGGQYFNDTFTGPRSLVDLNDTYRASFEEIAALIESHPLGLFIWGNEEVTK